MIPTARQLLTVAAKTVAPMFKKEGGLGPLWHIVRSDGEHMIVASPLGDATDKDEVASAMRQLLDDVSAVAYVFVCESWLMLGGEDELIAAKRDGIREHPKRQECIWYAAEDAQGSLSAYQIIDRPEGQPARLLPIRVLEGKSRSEGRFTGMLPVKGRMH